MEPLGTRLPGPPQSPEPARRGVGGAWVVGGAGRAAGLLGTLRKRRAGLAPGWAPGGGRGHPGGWAWPGERIGAGRVLGSASP